MLITKRTFKKRYVILFRQKKTAAKDIGMKAIDVDKTVAIDAGKKLVDMKCC